VWKNWSRPGAPRVTPAVACASALCRPFQIQKRRGCRGSDRSDKTGLSDVIRTPADQFGRDRLGAISAPRGAGSGLRRPEEAEAASPQGEGTCPKEPRPETPLTLPSLAFTPAQGSLPAVQEEE
jgi:hypothetical protein